MPGRPDLDENIQFDRDKKRSPWIDLADGETGKYDSGTGELLPNASQGLSAGLTWVRLDDGRGAMAVVNGAVDPVSPGVPVLTAINRRTNAREVVSINFPAAVSKFGVTVARRMATPLPLLFDSDALLIGKVDPSTGTTIYVHSFVHDATFFEGDTFNLSALIGAISANMQVMAKVGVDEAANAVSVTLGGEELLSHTFTRTDADLIPLPTGVVPLAALVLRAGQTQAVDSFSLNPKRYFDLRQFLNIASGNVAVFDRILTDHNGNVLSDHNGNVLIGY